MWFNNLLKTKYKIYIHNITLQSNYVNVIVHNKTLNSFIAKLLTLEIILISFSFTARC